MSVPVSTIALLLAGTPLAADPYAGAGLSLAASQDAMPASAGLQGSAPAEPPSTPVPATAPPGTPAPVEPSPAAPPGDPAQQAQTPLVDPAPPPAESTEPADIVVTARPRNVPGDPLQEVNAKSFATTQSVDRAVVGPVAIAYKTKVPGPIRRGLRNFLYNLREPIVALNFLIQLKPGKAIETVARFATNSTIGVAGLFDVAKKKPFNLPRRRNGFANSLGYYGVRQGAFLFLPLIGPTTVRDFLGDGLDRLLIPGGLGAPFDKLAFTLPAGVLSAVDYRAEFDEQLTELRAASDPYAASRAYYLRRRQAEIDHLRGRDRAPAATARHSAETTPAFTPAPVPTPAATEAATPSAVTALPAHSPDAAAPDRQAPLESLPAPQVFEPQAPRPQGSEPPAAAPPAPPPAAAGPSGQR